MKNIAKYGIHITHNDSDAVGCALVAAFVYTEYNLENNTYFCSATGASEKLNKILDDIEKSGEHYPGFILISDISIDEETAVRLEGIRDLTGTKLLGMDHHPTNHLYIKHDWFHVICEEKYSKEGVIYICDNGLRYDPVINKNVPISACRFIFDDHCDKEGQYNPVIQGLVDSISRYDTWVWKNYTPSQISHINSIGTSMDDITSVLSKFLGSNNLFQQLYNNAEKLPSQYTYGYNDWIDYFFGGELLNLYHILKRKENLAVKSIIKRTKVIDRFHLDNSDKLYKVAMFISTDEYSNAQAEYIYNLSDEIDFVIIIYPSTCNLGFRCSKNKDIDVSSIAKSYGGGGHKNASGAKLTEELLYNEILRLYYSKESYPLTNIIKKD